MSKHITEQLGCLLKQRDVLRQSFTNHTGDDVGKVTDPEAVHEIECLDETIELLEKVRDKKIILFTPMKTQ